MLCDAMERALAALFSGFWRALSGLHHALVGLHRSLAGLHRALWLSLALLGALWPRSLAFSGALCRLSGALWRPLILVWTLNGPLAAFGGLGLSGALWRPLVLVWTLDGPLAAFGGLAAFCGLAALSGALWRSLALSGARWRSLALAGGLKY